MWEILKFDLRVVVMVTDKAPVEVEFLSVVIVVFVTEAQLAVLIRLFQPDAALNNETLSPASKE